MHNGWHQNVMASGAWPRTLGKHWRPNPSSPQKGHSHLGDLHVLVHEGLGESEGGGLVRRVHYGRVEDPDQRTHLRAAQRHQRALPLRSLRNRRSLSTRGHDSGPDRRGDSARLEGYGVAGLLYGHLSGVVSGSLAVELE